MQYVTGALGLYLIILPEHTAQQLAADWAALRGEPSATPSADVQALLHLTVTQRLTHPDVTSGRVPKHPLRVMHDQPELSAYGVTTDTPFLPTSRLIALEDHPTLAAAFTTRHDQDLIERAAGLRRPTTEAHHA